MVYNEVSIQMAAKSSMLFAVTFGLSDIPLGPNGVRDKRPMDEILEKALGQIEMSPLFTSSGWRWLSRLERELTIDIGGERLASWSGVDAWNSFGDPVSTLLTECFFQSVGDKKCWPDVE